MINVHFNIQTNYLCVWVVSICEFQIRFKYTIYNRRIMFSYIITNNMYSNIAKVYEQIQFFDSLNFFYQSMILIILHKIETLVFRVTQNSH